MKVLGIIIIIALGVDIFANAMGMIQGRQLMQELRRIIEDKQWPPFR